MSVEVMCQRSKAPPSRFQPLHRHELTPWPRGGRDALGLFVGVALDISPVRCDDDESRMRAVILQPLDELAVGLGLGVGEGGMWHLRIERSVEFVGVSSRSRPVCPCGRCCPGSPGGPR